MYIQYGKENYKTKHIAKICGNIIQYFYVFIIIYSYIYIVVIFIAIFTNFFTELYNF